MFDPNSKTGIDCFYDSLRDKTFRCLRAIR